MIGVVVLILVPGFLVTCWVVIAVWLKRFGCLGCLLGVGLMLCLVLLLCVLVKAVVGSLLFDCVLGVDLLFGCLIVLLLLDLH